MLVREKLLFEKDIRPYLKVEPLSQAHPRQKQLYLCVKLVRNRRKGENFQLIALPLAAFTKGRIKEAATDFVCIFGIYLDHTELDRVSESFLLQYLHCVV